MKALATLLLSVSLQGGFRIPPPTPPADRVAPKQTARKGGRWYFAENGHAVYCLGLLPGRQEHGAAERLSFLFLVSGFWFLVLRFQ